MAFFWLCSAAWHARRLSSAEHPSRPFPRLTRAPRHCRASTRFPDLASMASSCSISSAASLSACRRRRNVFGQTVRTAVLSHVLPDESVNFTAIPRSISVATSLCLGHWRSVCREASPASRSPKVACSTARPQRDTRRRLLDGDMDLAGLLCSLPCLVLAACSLRELVAQTVGFAFEPLHVGGQGVPLFLQLGRELGSERLLLCLERLAPPRETPPLKPVGLLGALQLPCFIRRERRRRRKSGREIGGWSFAAARRADT